MQGSIGKLNQDMIAKRSFPATLCYLQKCHYRVAYRRKKGINDALLYSLDCSFPNGEQFARSQFLQSRTSFKLSGTLPVMKSDFVAIKSDPIEAKPDSTQLICRIIA